MLRTGAPFDADDVQLNRYFHRSGRDRKRAIVRLLPDDYSFDDRRVLDFGCGSGRVLRHFLREARTGEFWGCDLHEPSIEWVTENLSPPINAHLLNGAPRLPHPDAHFDLVYAISVFTHITDDWSAWLPELHRVLKPGGFLISTFLRTRHLEEMGGSTGPGPRTRIESGIAFLELHHDSRSPAVRTCSTRAGGCASTGGAPLRSSRSSPTGSSLPAPGTASSSGGSATSR